MAGRFWDKTPNFGLPLHWNDGGMTDGRLHNALALMLDDIIVSIGGTWKGPVASAAALPLIGNADGDARITLDTHTVYVWNNAITAWVPIGGGVYAGSFEQVVKPTVAQIPDGWWGYWWDTVNSQLWHVRNRGGAMYAVRLTPLP